uniref:60S ribosomal protein L13 n=1 Tax=Aceria tosichella TaxID=561515 RepID=A0A6G1S8U4_9ACAR
MAIRGNRVVPNAHFHKDWQRYIKTWFDQPARKKRRHQKRAEKSARIAPRPLKKLRPVVRCPGARFNMRQRLGRGFTVEELKAAGVSAKVAQTIGIAVDKRRKNRSVESLQENVQRLKEYKSRLIVFPINRKRPKKGDSSEQECRLAAQVEGDILPVKKVSATEKPRKVTAAEKKFAAFHTVRQARVNKKLAPGRAKKAREAEAEAKDKAK